MEELNVAGIHQVRRLKRRCRITTNCHIMTAPTRRTCVCCPLLQLPSCRLLLSVTPRHVHLHHVSTHQTLIATDLEE